MKTYSKTIYLYINNNDTVLAYIYTQTKKVKDHINKIN